MPSMIPEKPPMAAQANMMPSASGSASSDSPMAEAGGDEAHPLAMEGAPVAYAPSPRDMDDTVPVPGRTFIFSVHSPRTHSIVFQGRPGLQQAAETAC